MKNYSKITPEGTRDILFEECRARRVVQQRLSNIFSLRGYHEVMTPGLEYYDVFSLPGAAVPQQEMYKSTDNHGRLMVFRPDSTLPIARLTASRLQGHIRPLRLFYSQNIYRNRPDLSGRSHETAQMGIELMGASGLRADLEVISTAVEALSSCMKDFRIELGHARLFRILADRLPVSEEVKEKIRSTIEMKNYAALTELLDPLGDTPATEAIKRLPRLFGGEEAIEEAGERFLDSETAEVINYLKDLYSALCEMGLGDRLMVDLGLVQRNDYYTGIVFSAYTHKHGDAVLMGGRYDALCEKFGAPMPAVGFAIDLDAAASFELELLERETPPEILIFGEAGFEPRAQLLLSELTSQGIACEMALCDTEQAALEYAGSAGLLKLMLVGREIKEICLKGGEVL